MKQLIRFIITHARIFGVLAIVLPIVGGVAAYDSMPKEGSPEIAVPVAIVSTVYVGASPKEVESLVTNPLEDELAGLKNLKDLRSYSIANASIVACEFTAEADLDRALQDVRNAVSAAGPELPEGAESPVVKEISVSDIPVMIVSLTGELDPIRLKNLGQEVADELSLLPEVLDVNISGGLEREIQVYLDPDRLNQFGLTVGEVAQAIQAADISIPAGAVEVSGRRYLLRSLTEIKRVEDYARVPLINRDGRTVYLSDVASIQDGHSEDLTFSRVNGRPSVSLAVSKRSGANILKTAEKIKQTMARLEDGFPAGVAWVVTGDQSTAIKDSFKNINNSAITGFFVVIVVLLFAMGLRNSVITSLAIPLSLLLTFILLKLAGLTNNDMVRFSLVLCIGLLVDNAIIVVENCYHHFQLGKSRFEAVIDGVSEIALPVISATLTTVFAFLPMLLMTGVTGEFMGFMPKTVALALTSSLIVALVASPLILSRVMQQTKKHGQVVDPEEDLKTFKRLYAWFVAKALGHKLALVAVTVALLSGVGAIFYMGAIKIEMFPESDFDYIYITINTPPGSRVEATDAVAREVEALVARHAPEAVRVVASVGYQGASAFELSMRGKSPTYGEVSVELLKGSDYARADHKQIQARLRPGTLAIAGAEVNFRALKWGPPTGDPVDFKILGPDLEELARLSRELKDVLAGVPGAVEVKDDFEAAAPEVRVGVLRREAAALGVPAVSIAQALRAATAGVEIKDFKEEADASRKYAMTVRLAPEARESLELLGRLKVRATDGRLVPLADVVEFSIGPGLNAIRHIDQRRAVEVRAKNEGRPAVEITKELIERLADYPLPPGYSLSFAGDFAETEESFASLRLAYVIAVILILTLLVAQFNSFMQPLAIMAALPLSVVGAVAGLLATGNNFSIMSFVGLVGLTGIVVNDSIVLVDCINRFRKQTPDMVMAVILAGKQRLRPILSTTLTTIGGLLTLTLTDEMWEGLGVVIIFGIGFATVLTLVVVPVMYHIFESLGRGLYLAVLGARPHPAKGAAGLPPEGAPAWRVSRARGSRLIGLAFIAVQLAALVLAWRYLAPWFMGYFAGVEILAASPLNLAVEWAVFLLEAFLVLMALAFVLFAPAIAGLLYLRWRQIQESFYWQVYPGEVYVHALNESFFVPAHAIRKVGASRLTGRVWMKLAHRTLAIGPVLEGPPPQKRSLAAWLAAPRPRPSQRRAARDSLLKAIGGLEPKVEEEEA